MQDVKRDYLITLRNSEISLKVEEMRSQEDKVEDPLLIKTAKPAEIKFADNGVKKGFFLMEEKMMGFLIAGFQINLM